MTLRIRRFLHVETVLGEPITVGERVLVPVARTLSVVARPGGLGLGIGFNWTRPVAVEVVGPNGSQRVAIPNVDSRRFLGLALALALLAAARALVRARARSGS